MQLPSPAPDPHNAFITWLDGSAEAKPGPLSGKTLLVKDLFDTAGGRTTYGSKLYANHVPERTAPSGERPGDAGAVIAGKAALHAPAGGARRPEPRHRTVWK